MDDQQIKEMHEKFLYPIVRVSTQKSAGSGTIIYSQLSRSKPESGIYQTFILTNWHVIEDNIKYKKDWNTILKRNIEKEILERCRVDIFRYVFTSTVNSSDSHWADIVCYDKEHDLALLMLDSPEPFKYPAKLIPKDKISELRLFMDVVVAGCSLAHEPFCNFGQITFLKEIIEGKKYLMTNASSIFGNSGGALFLKGTGELIGVPSRVTGIQLGFGFDVITWMGFSCHPERIYKFLEEQEMKFIYDESDCYESALERREKIRKESFLALRKEVVEEN